MAGQQKKIAALGDSGSVAAFRGLGLEVEVITHEKDVAQLLHSMILSDAYAVIYITEAVYAQCTEIIEAHRFDFLPALVPIPTAGKASSLGKDATAAAVRKAIGFDIFASEDEAVETEEEKE